MFYLRPGMTNAAANLAVGTAAGGVANTLFYRDPSGEHDPFENEPELTATQNFSTGARRGG